MRSQTVRCPSRRYKLAPEAIGLLAVIVCFELGVFLHGVSRGSATGTSTTSRPLPFWFQNIWRSPYFRGAISGLGVLNICDLVYRGLSSAAVFSAAPILVCDKLKH